MALVKRQTNSTRLLLIFAVVVVVGAVGYFLSRQLFSTSVGVNINVPGSSQTVITNFGEQILNDSRYTQLQTYGGSVQVDLNTDIGQPQPFQ